MNMLHAKAGLGEAMEALEIAKEMRRVEEVVKTREEEINFDSHVDDCPICLDPMYPGHPDRLNICCLFCCGKEICVPCYRNVSERGLRECPLCRYASPITATVAERMKLKHAKARPYFQRMIGREYFEGKRGGISSANDQKAFEYTKMAAEGGDTEAQALLGFFYSASPRNIVKTSKKKALYRRESAASNGHLVAHQELAFMYFKGQGCEKNLDLSYKMVTFAAHHGILRAQLNLSNYFNGGIDGIPMSLERAKYWLGKAVRANEPEIVRERMFLVYAEYAKTVLFLSTNNMDGVVNIPGHCPVPEVLFWLRKAKHWQIELPEGHANAMRLCEKIGSEFCHQCIMNTEAYEAATKKKTMAKCKRCKWAQYCGRECQLKHWNSGHKDECKKKY
mmetsp:Transcript_6834/g.15110  ORF Transcript_6834/g.15110 Transcript_6834/m.15110 type:complete len:392 (+) Transcript_6834:272-1447(+)